MTIFIAGVHGVGKTCLAQQVAERLGIRYATASQLIQEERGYASWSSNKKVGEVDDNQAALVAAVNRIKDSGQLLLLDGHFVLRKAAGDHERLPEGVFRDLRCKSVVLLTCAPSVILARLLARGDDSWSEREVISFANSEADHAASICTSLAIPLTTLESPTPEEFELVVTSSLAGVRRNSG